MANTLLQNVIDIQNFKVFQTARPNFVKNRVVAVIAVYSLTVAFSRSA